MHHRGFQHHHFQVSPTGRRVKRGFPWLLLPEMHGIFMPGHGSCRQFILFHCRRRFQIARMEFTGRAGLGDQPAGGWLALDRHGGSSPPWRTPGEGLRRRVPARHNDSVAPAQHVHGRRPRASAAAAPLLGLAWLHSVSRLGTIPRMPQLIQQFVDPGTPGPATFGGRTWAVSRFGWRTGLTDRWTSALVPRIRFGQEVPVVHDLSHLLHPRLEATRNLHCGSSDSLTSRLLHSPRATLYLLEWPPTRMP